MSLAPEFRIEFVRSLGDDDRLAFTEAYREAVAENPDGGPTEWLEMAADGLGLGDDLEEFTWANPDEGGWGGEAG